MVEILHLGADQSVITVSEEVDDVMALAAALRAAQPRHVQPPTFRQVAEFPVALVEILRAKGLDILNDPAAMKKVLNDPEFAAFRTTAGRV